MAERRPVTATEIRRDVEGYSDMTEDAFARRFYADRAELDALGIHLRVDKPADGLAKIDTAIYRRKRIEFEYFTMQSGETSLRKVDPYHLLFEGGQWYLVGHSHERGAVRVFRLSRIRGKVAYSTKAEHDFQRPADFDPRGYASRIPWQLGDPVATGGVWVSEKIAWYVERQFGAYGTMRDAEDGGRIFRTDYAIPRLLVSWALRFGDQARGCHPPEHVDESRARLDAIIERHRGEAFTSVA